MKEIKKGEVETSVRSLHKYMGEIGPETCTNGGKYYFQEATRVGKPEHL